MATEPAWKAVAAGADGALEELVAGTCRVFRAWCPCANLTASSQVCKYGAQELPHRADSVPGIAAVVQNHLVSSTSHRGALTEEQIEERVLEVVCESKFEMKSSSFRESSLRAGGGR